METSAEVAAWGAQWLNDWITDPSASDDDRQTRLWLAEKWQTWNLEDWLYWATHDRRVTGGHDWDEHSAIHAAENHFRLYQRERNGLLVWRMYSEHRMQGLPIPEAILRKFDQWAERLEFTTGAKEVAAAIEMTGPGGGPQGAAHLRKVERQRRLVSDVQLLIDHGLSPALAHKRVAAINRLTCSAVRNACHRWNTKEQSGRGGEAAVEPENLRLLRLLGG